MFILQDILPTNTQGRTFFVILNILQHQINYIIQYWNGKHSNENLERVLSISCFPNDTFNVIRWERSIATCKSILYISYKGCIDILKFHQTTPKPFISTTLEKNDKEVSPLHALVEKFSL